MRNDDKTVESTEVQVRDKGNQDLVDVLTTGDGPLTSGCQPGVTAATETGQKNLCEALATGDDKVQVKRPPKVERATKAEPKTLEEFHPHLLSTPKQKKD